MVYIALDANYSLVVLVWHSICTSHKDSSTVLTCNKSKKGEVTQRGAIKGTNSYLCVACALFFRRSPDSFYLVDNEVTTMVFDTDQGQCWLVTDDDYLQDEDETATLKPSLATYGSYSVNGWGQV